VFEYIDKNPIFGVVQPDSPLWAPILGLFAVTGIPTAGGWLRRMCEHVVTRLTQQQQQHQQQPQMQELCGSLHHRLSSVRHPSR
jgi:hypothetical protein